MCTTPGIARSSFYHWRKTAAARAPRRADDAKLAARIRKAHRASHGTYGVPRSTAELMAAKLPDKPTPKGKPSCDEYAFNATYESGGMPKTPDGGANPYLVDNGEECVQTYESLNDDGTLRFRDDGNYPEPDWTKVKCGRSSISLEVNSGAMRLFGQFASSNRLLDADGYYVWTGLTAAGCDWTAEKVICDAWANGFPEWGQSATKLSPPRR